MVTALGKFLRYSLNKNSDMVTIKEDIEQVKNYLIIQKIRFGDKIKINFDIDEKLYDKKYLNFNTATGRKRYNSGLEPKIGNGFINIKGIY